MESLEVGDLVRDKLNTDDGSYGLGVVVSTDSTGLLGEDVHAPRKEPHRADQDIPGKRYDVYFNKFERTITFHGDYLEKI
jgi:hypothetical protein|tara:strand:+ start:271 stop:510 length:240 start_codon:yes stop_codon:yes gene_type:complete